MPLYFYIMMGSLIVPMLYSIFQMDFIKHWKNFTISTGIVATFFLIWDATFTAKGVWGFNHEYCLNLFIFGMPIEEYLFFLIIPFVSLFTHYALLYAAPNLMVNKTMTHLFTFGYILLAVVLIAINPVGLYTTINFSIFIITLLVGWKYDFKLLQKFIISYFIILVPFFIVNGILTGVATASPVVWYNNLENSGIRITTIPIEDFAYAFTMLFGNLMIFESLKSMTK